MFGLFRKKKLTQEEIYRRAEACLGQLLMMQGDASFRQMMGVGFLGFTKNSVFYSADFSKMSKDTICFVKLSEVPFLETMRPVKEGPIPMVPQELIHASLMLTSMVKTYPDGKDVFA